MIKEKHDPLLEEAIAECKAFLQECDAYNERINKYWFTRGVDSYKRYEDAGTERGVLKARSLLLIRKLQAWRKKGSVCDK